MRRNVAGAKNLIARVKAIDMRTDSPPWAVCHGFLAHGADYQLLDPRSGQQVSALRTVLIDPGTAVELHRGAWRFRRANAPGTYERHLGQFSYLIVQSGVRPRRNGRDVERRLWLIWTREKIEFHTLQDPSWIFPTCCLLGEREPWSNKFGERFDGDRLLELLKGVLSAATAEEPPCAGTHALYALALARKSLSLPVSASRRQELDRLWSEQVRRILDALAPDGRFDLNRYSGSDDSGPDPAGWNLHVRGHLIECLFVSPDPALFAELRVQRMVGHTIHDAGLYLDSTTGLAAPDRDRAFTYASACHLAHGLRLYAQVCARLQPASHPHVPAGAAGP